MMWFIDSHYFAGRLVREAVIESGCHTPRRAATSFKAEANGRGMLMTAECPECGAPIVNGFICECGVNQNPVGAAVSDGGARQEEVPELKTAIANQIKAKKKEHDQTTKAILELRSRKLELATNSMAWLKAFHACWLGGFEPKGVVEVTTTTRLDKYLARLGAFVPKGVVEEPVVKLGENPRKSEILGDDVRTMVSALILAFYLFIFALVILVPVIRFTALLFLGLFALYTLYKYIKWRSTNAGRSKEFKESLGIQAGELAEEIEALRIRYAAEQGEIKALEEHVRRLSEAETTERKPEIKNGSPDQTQGAAPETGEVAPDTNPPQDDEYPWWYGRDPENNAVVKTLSPLTVGSMIFFCFPIGLLVLWKHPVLGRIKAWWWAGAIWGFLVLCLALNGDDEKRPTSVQAMPTATAPVAQADELARATTATTARESGSAPSVHPLFFDENGRRVVYRELQAGMDRIKIQADERFGASTKEDNLRGVLLGDKRLKNKVDWQGEHLKMLFEETRNRYKLSDEAFGDLLKEAREKGW